MFLLINRHKKIYLKLKNYIRECLPVHCFSDNDRKKYNITNKLFGDIIFLINNKLAFSPNLFGFLKMKAYHGYLPKTMDNKGVFLYKSIREKKIGDISSIKAYEIIKNNLRD